MGSKKNRNGAKRFGRALITRDWRRLSFDEAAKGMTALFVEGEHSTLLEMLETRPDGKKLAREGLPLDLWSDGRMGEIDFTIHGVPFVMGSPNLMLISALTMSKDMLVRAMKIAEVGWDNRVEAAGGVACRFCEMVVLCVCATMEASAASPKPDGMKAVHRGRGLSILMAAAEGSSLTPFPARQGDVLLPSKGDPVAMARLMKAVPEALEIFLAEKTKREGVVIAGAIDGVLAEKADDASPPVKVKSWKDRVA